MLLSVLAALAMLLPPNAAPGDGLGLVGGPDGASVHRPPLPSPLPAAPVSPVPPLGGAAMVAAVAAGVVTRRRHRGPFRPVPAGRTASPPPDPVVIFVSGHGSDHLATFAELADMMGLPPDRVRYFDYRFALTGTTDHVTASEEVPIDEAAIALHAYAAGVAAAGTPVYLVGHSKGGAAIAEMLSRWDEMPGLAVAGVTGAVLLDPPIATGFLGALQRAGGVIGPVPDNGGYDPITCDWLVLCRDLRSHLGEQAGVEVLVIRNPDAWLTNFHDRPEGLRVLDLDDGDGHAVSRFWEKGSVVGRVTAAHVSVLHHPAVARCVAAEIASPGSCRWTGTGRRREPPRGWPGTGPGRSPNVMR
jgi:hypothetical protein